MVEVMNVVVIIAWGYSSRRLGTGVAETMVMSGAA
jgi:hypothetical protein